MWCQRCGGEQFIKAGFNQAGHQMYACTACRRRQTAHSASAFHGYRFPEEIIALSVRWCNGRLKDARQSRFKEHG
jgi:transposase-like protein